jgi:Fic family protein
MSPMPVEDAIALIQMEYAELPELRLTFRQAQRLWDLSPDLCERALSKLIESGYLVRAADGAYVRSWDPRQVVEDIESIVRAM